MKLMAMAALLVATNAPAQIITSYRAENAARIKGDPNRIVCQKEEPIGTRLGTKKVCLTVAEWQQRAKEDREQTERVQSGARVCANPPCP